MPRAGSFDAGRWRVSTSYASRIGHLNEVNEDSVCLERLADGTWLFAVADGIGGYAGGEVASAVTVATLAEVTAAAVGSPCARLCAGVAEANRRILQLQKARGAELAAMGTTLTALAIAPTGEAGVAHVGDSRLYRLAGGTLSLMTRDHNVGTELVREGLIDAAALAHHPQRHMLTRALGVGEDAHPDSFSLAVGVGDAFVLVTDGMIDALGEDEIARVAATCQGERWPGLGPALGAAAAKHMNGDDATVVAVALHASAALGANS
jgi:serine/threonine protein phosphatase PrpC